MKIPESLELVARNIETWPEGADLVAAFEHRDGVRVIGWPKNSPPTTVEAYDFSTVAKARRELGLVKSGIETPEEKEELDRIEKRLIGDNKYTVKIKGIPMDVYDVLKAFNVTNPGDQHAIKKMLKAGQRGYKDANQDREEAIASLKRAIELDSDDEM